MGVAIDGISAPRPHNFKGYLQMIILGNSHFVFEAANKIDGKERLPKRLQKKVKKASIKKLMKHNNVGKKEAQDEYRRLCRQIEIQHGTQVLALSFEYDPTTGLLHINTFR
jgi:hypothetical protein